MIDYQNASADDARQFMVDHCADYELKLSLIELISTAAEAGDRFVIGKDHTHHGIGINGVVFIYFSSRMINLHIGLPRQKPGLASMIRAKNLIAAIADINLYLARTRLAERKMWKWASRP